MTDKEALSAEHAGRKKSESQIVGLLQNLMHSAEGSAQPKAFSYRNPDHFDELWGMLREKDASERCPIVVVADGLPESKADWRDYVSVFAWASANCLSGCLPFVVLMLEKRYGSCGLSAFEPLRGGFYSPCQLDELLLSAANPTAVTLNDGQKLNLRQQWKAKLFEGRALSENSGSLDSHSISNQIGPLIMRAGIDDRLCETWDEPGTTNIAAELTFVRTLFPESRKAGRFHGLEKAKILIVDDQAEEGFASLISDVLGNNSGVTCRSGVLDDTDHLLGMEILKASSPRRRQYLHSADLVFLDLRLWVQKDEKSILGNYRDIALAIDQDLICRLVGNREHLGCSDYDRQTLGADFDRLVKSGSHKRLALLPLIIQALDPSLPIILFSATQHRSVVQALRGCPTILADFSKPFLNSADHDAYEPATVMSGLYMALERALPIMQIRSVWKAAVGEWGEGQFKQVHWSVNWPPENLFGDLDPFNFLAREWLPLGHRGEFTLAAAEPWHYLVKTVGSTRLAILEREIAASAVYSENAQLEEISACFRIIRSAQLVPLLPSSAEARQPIEIAIIAAKALIRLISLWTKEERA